MPIIPEKNYQTSLAGNNKFHKNYVRALDESFQSSKHIDIVFILRADALKNKKLDFTFKNLSMVFRNLRDFS